MNAVVGNVMYSKNGYQFWSHLWLKRLCSAETGVDHLWCLFVFNGAFLQVSSLFSNLQCAVNVSEGPSHKISAVIHQAELLLFCYRRRCIETCALTCQKLTCSMAPMLSSSRPGLHHEPVEMPPLSTLLFVLQVWTSRKIYYVLLLHWIPDVACCISVGAWRTAHESFLSRYGTEEASKQAKHKLQMHAHASPHTIYRRSTGARRNSIKVLTNKWRSSSIQVEFGWQPKDFSRHFQIPEGTNLDLSCIGTVPQVAERDRAESSCISLLSLIHNRYDLFVHPQAQKCRNEIL